MSPKITIQRPNKFVLCVIAVCVIGALVGIASALKATSWVYVAQGIGLSGLCSNWALASYKRNAITAPKFNAINVCFFALIAASWIARI